MIKNIMDEEADDLIKIYNFPPCFAKARQGLF